jgi:tetratricopeptide (TPR) repeat protein
MAIRLNPGDMLAFNNRGLAYNERKQYDKAVADLTEAIRLKPDYAEAFEIRAAAHEKLGKKAAAANDREKAKQLRGQ